MHDLKQLSILHISDLHFGRHHRFVPRATPDSDIPRRRGMPNLLESIRADFDNWYPDSPVIIAATGDLTESAKAEEFDQATNFLSGLSEPGFMAQGVSLEELFVVPGNHDVIFSESNKDQRWQPFCSFYQNLFRRQVFSKEPEDLNVVHDRSMDLGAVVVELNSCVSVEKGSPDEQRGQIDVGSIQSIRDQLLAVEPTSLRESIRIALVHHHPVLLPTFAESSRGYDCIINSDKLLMVLRDFGFHLILHGHKHIPHVFSYDAICAWTSEENNPTVIVAGGSASSQELPPLPNACNTYNRLIIKWNPGAQEGRVMIETRGLVISDHHGRELLPKDWHWVPIRWQERLITPQSRMPEVGRVSWRAFTQGSGETSEEARIQQYECLRGNMPVVEVLPSLISDQAYEARVWIEEHRRSKSDIPERVVWPAGNKFHLAVCEHHENPHFSAGFEYWGPMLVQARMFFKDGEEASGHVYARLPKSNF